MHAQGRNMKMAAQNPLREPEYAGVISPEDVENLKKSNKEIECLLSSLTTILIGLSPQIQVTRWNAIAENVFGVASTQITGQSLADSGIEWDWSRIEHGISLCLRECDSVRVDDIGFVQPNGRQGYLGFTISPIRSDNGELIGFIIIGADITNRKALEDTLAQTEKLKSIGQLAAGIAHEINTPTQYVGDNTRFLQDAFQDIIQVLNSFEAFFEAAKTDGVSADLIQKIEEDIEEADVGYLIEEIPTAIDHTLQGVERIAKIVRAMKEFSHPGQDEKTAIDINKTIESTITVARNEWKYVAEMETDFDASLPLVPCLPGELNQVILNLIINAAHAIADVIAENSTEKGLIKVSTRLKENWAEIQISDSGPGIPEEIRHRIFDPFFTTKEVGKGTGQGLAISHTVIVEKHGGTLNLETQEGKGTTFSIYLPLIDKSS
jgi:PAS domain S-box-containing protein